MTRVVFVFLFLVFVTVRSDIVDDDDEKIILNCTDGEEEDYCPSTCMNDKCPRKENYLHMCVSDGCGRPRCKCQFNTKRAPNGTCIDTKFCPPFKCHNPHEEFVACPPYCPKDDCDHASPEGLCLINGLILVAECQPACRCIKGYWRKDGECVPYSECLVPVTSLPPVFFGK